MFSISSEGRNDMQNVPISSVRINLRTEEEKLMIQRDAALDDPDIRFELYDQIDDIVREADRILSPSGQDRYGVMITGTNQNGTEVRIGISYRNWSQINADLLLHHIEQKLNSAETLYLDLTFTFSIRYADGNFNLGRKIGWNGNASWYASHKRCIIQIHPEKDPYIKEEDCLWQFLILGYAFLVHKQEIESGLPFIDSLTYKKIVSSSSKFKLRHELGNELRKQIDSDNFEEIIQKFEEKFNVKIILYSLISFLQVEYPKKHLLPLNDRSKCIFGLVTSEIRDKWEHVDFITNPAALSLKKSECNRVCYYCFEIYSRHRNCSSIECSKNTSDRCFTCHTCSGVCISCFHSDCWKVTNNFDEKCPSCKVKFQSQLCKDLHINFCVSNKHKTCDVCFRNEHRGLKCNEYNCMMCGMKETFENKENHECYLKRQKLKKISNLYWCYDFETCLNESNDHILYLATVTCLYWKENYEVLKDKYMWKQVKGYTVFYFWGLENVMSFFDFVCEPVLNGSIFFAHNAGKYDSIFVEKYLFERKKLHCSKIQQGLRLMQLFYPQIEVTFKDSLLFIPTSLRSMSCDFGIEELKKGFFPHKIMTVEFLKDSSSTNFIVKCPDRSYFQEDFNFYNYEKEEIELTTFLENFYKQQFWNLKEDAIDYCISDTILLAEVLKVFREKTLQITSSDFDPLNYVTLPSAVMKYYLSCFIPEKSISIIDRYSSLMKREEMLWLLWIKFQSEELIVFDFTNNINGIEISASHKDTVFIFHPCYDHGCKNCYRGKSRNFRSSKTFNECYLEQHNNERFLLSNGYVLKTIWEHEWMKVKDLPSFQNWYEENIFEIEENLPLDPREAYKGGVSELYKFSVKKDIQMVDFVSQYPTSLFGSSFSPYTNEKVEWYLPTGKAMKKNPSTFLLSDKLAIIKCKILPPSKLYAPFLGYRAKSILSGTYEVIYGLCRTCMDERNLQLCNHSECEREIIGTWTSCEIQHALELGYKITKMIDVWEYDSKSNKLFTDFITPFMITKIVSKKDGLVVNDCFTDKGKLIVEYVKDVCNRELGTSEFKNNPAERMIAKLMMNSFYGKWGQRSSWPETGIFSKKETEKCLKILSDPSYEVLYGEVVKRSNEMFVVIEYERKIASVKGDSTKNDHIAAFVTAYGRIMLNTLIQKVGDGIIYSDTDSAFIVKENKLPFQTGFRIGDLELELKHGTNWCGLGRKSYGFEVHEKVVCKQKGISLKKSMMKQFTPDYLRQVFLYTKKAFYDLKKSDENEENRLLFKKLKKSSEEGTLKSIVVDQKKFQSVREDRLTMKKQSILQEKRTAFLLWGLKRIPLWENEECDIIDSLPFGYSY